MPGSGCPCGKPREGALGVVAVLSEALRSECVRHAFFSGLLELRDDGRHVVRGDVAKYDLETIALEVPGLELVPMPRGAKDRDALDLTPERFVERAFSGERHRDGLRGDCVLVLHPRVTRVPRIDPERASHAPHRFLCRELAFRDFEVEMFPFAARSGCRARRHDEVPGRLSSRGAPR